MFVDLKAIEWTERSVDRRNDRNKGKVDKGGRQKKLLRLLKLKARNISISEEIMEGAKVDETDEI